LKNTDKKIQFLLSVIVERQCDVNFFSNNFIGGNVMGLDNDPFLDVLQNIEVGLKIEYEKNKHLTDRITINALDNAKIAVKQEYGFAKNQKIIVDDETKGIIDWCVVVGKERINGINNLTLEDYLNRIEKVKHSVNRHSAYGRRGYYEFIKDFV
jgi:hypothetical protein